MTGRYGLAVASFLACSTSMPLAEAAGPVAWSIVTPASSVHHPENDGKRAHTNYLRLVPYVAKGAKAVVPSGVSYETPGSLACVYNLVTATAGCNPGTAKIVPTGGSRAIAVVDAYDYPNASADLATFNGYFGLPAASFQVVYASGRRPGVDRTGEWESEEALDIETAHALAPGAKLYLVEAASDSTNDLMAAVNTATQLVTAAGGGEVSMSWGMGEWSGESSYNSYFNHAGVTYLAAAGDEAGPEFPAVIQYVLGAGGTTILRNSAGNYESQQVWSDTGGGTSRYIGRPSYQSSVLKVVSLYRGTPDLAFDADPNSGVWFYDSLPSDGYVGWQQMGGTSLATPALAAILNAHGYFSGSIATLTALYGAPTTHIEPVTTGWCGPWRNTVYATSGYDLCTGLGVWH